jgi:copper(I)-binding protein
MGTAGAAYLHIRNDGNSADTLLEVLAEGQAGMLMTTEGTRMIMVSREAISPGADVTMRPGGMHLMFEGLRTSTTVGDTVPLTLRFARAGELGVRVPVVAYGEMP